MSKYIALLIDTLNHDASISKLLNPVERINKLMVKHKNNWKPKKNKQNRDGAAECGFHPCSV